MQHAELEQKVDEEAAKMNIAGQHRDGQQYRFPANVSNNTYIDNDNYSLCLTSPAAFVTSETFSYCLSSILCRSDIKLQGK
jgi:hypothetical protein